MFKTFYISFLLLAFTTISLNAQNILTHNTGQVQMSIFDNGYIGHNFDATQGAGVKFGTAPDAMFTAGPIFGNLVFGVNGVVGSFVSGTPQVPIIKDLVTTTPFSGFTSDAFFNQKTECILTDGASPTPYNLTIKQKTYSNTGDKFVFITYEITNNAASAISGFRVGLFSDWDIGAAAYLSNRAGMDIPRNMAYQYLQGTADPNYYGFVAFNGMTGAAITDVFPGNDQTIRFEIYNLVNSIFDSTSSTRIADYRTFMSSGPISFAAGQTVMYGFAMVVGTNLAELQASADAALLKYNSQILPVELTSFTASVGNNGQVTLNWTTATELNNQMFEIERRITEGQYSRIGYVNGNGTTTQAQSYSFTDKSVEAGKYFYRLKQIDFQGTFEYSNEIEVDVTSPLDFVLGQNYPNPFNPSTIINFSIAEQSFVKLAVYNMIGEQISLLKNETMDAGRYDVSFDASNLPSGMYLYKLETANFTNVKKMVLIK